MEKIKVADLIEFNDKKFNPKVLVNEPGYRMVLLNLRAGQSVPEHANPGRVTVYAIRGHITFYQAAEPCELREGEVVHIPAGVPHHLEAHADSALFVLATADGPETKDKSEEIDVRTIPHYERHALIFQKFDALEVGQSIRLLNDHDPVPLGMQFEQMRPGQTKWEYIERGPLQFRIRITRIAPASSSDVAFQTGGGLVGIRHSH